ncbi:MAG: hypothetical protein ABIV10_15805 [Gemmatimonadaceae bacterium]
MKTTTVALSLLIGVGPLLPAQRSDGTRDSTVLQLVDWMSPWVSSTEWEGARTTPAAIAALHAAPLPAAFHRA